MFNVKSKMLSWNSPESKFKKCMNLNLGRCSFYKKSVQLWPVCLKLFSDMEILCSDTFRCGLVQQAQAGCNKHVL